MTTRGLKVLLPIALVVIGVVIGLSGVSGQEGLVKPPHGTVAPLSSAAGQTLGAPNNGYHGLYIDYINTSTVGAVTLNVPSGRINVAGSTTSVLISNSLVTTNSHVFVVVSSNDATAQIKNVVPTAGAFTINYASTTGQTSMDFLVVGAN